MEALVAGLNESGILRYRRDSALYSDWQPKMLAAAKSNESSAGTRIWSMLSPATQAAILQNPNYIKINIQNQFLADLNAMLLRRDLYSPRAWHADSLSPVARELLAKINDLTKSQLARLNAALIGSAFSGIQVPDEPKRNLLGYFR